MNIIQKLAFYIFIFLITELDFYGWIKLVNYIRKNVRILLLLSLN